MIDIYHCFSCAKLLDGERSSKLDEEYFFWCGPECHKKYQDKIEEDGRILKEWSAFMCNEGKCPKELVHLTKENVEEPIAKAKNKARNKAGAQLESTGRKCGVCGQSGHNARTCARKEYRKPWPKTQKMSTRRQYICGKCGGLGHNARTCGK